MLSYFSFMGNTATANSTVDERATLELMARKLGLSGVEKDAFFKSLSMIGREGKNNASTPGD